MYKVIVFLTFAAAVSTHDIIVGSNSTGKKIYDQKKIASPALWQRADNITINATDSEVISRVVITDLRPDKDGDAKVVEGGEGKKNVTVELKSPAVLRGYDFHIEVYTIPDENGQNVNIPKEEDKLKENIPISIAADTGVNGNAKQSPKTGIDSTTLEGINNTSDSPKVEDVNVTAVLNDTNTDDADKKIKSTNDDKINAPVLTGKDQIRQYRDTENQDINNRKTLVDIQKGQRIPSVPYPTFAASNFGKNTETATADKHGNQDTLKGNRVTPQVYGNTPLSPVATAIDNTTDVSAKNVTEHKQLNAVETPVQNDKNQQLNPTVTIPSSTELQYKIDAVPTSTTEGTFKYTSKPTQDNSNIKNIKH